ncbi:MAG: SMP-30/gluconolactonase/LRE family protein [Planctomycetaceae bacterium]|nr:SMP-30/gluconolactonase/LRE family protein [Planctomycetaceae bacterium]
MILMFRCFFFLLFGICTAVAAEETVSVELYAPAAKHFFPANLQVEILSNGHQLAEGPVWHVGEDCLLFVDIPANSVYKWQKNSGVSVYLTPSGRTGFAPSLQNGVIGANGLAFDQKQSLVLCQHGDRRIAKLINPGEANPEFFTLASHFQGKRFNSPNDLTIAQNGDIFFTDPPGGYLDLANSNFEQGKVVFDTRHKELSFQGVYHYHADSRKVSLVTQKMNRPNGIALSRDGKRLYVGNAEGDNPHVMQFSTDDYTGKLFFDGPFRKQDKGVVDGMKVHTSGTLFVTGPGGIHLLSNEGARLAKIRLDQPVTNLCFDPNEQFMYFTTHHSLARLKLNRLSETAH